MARPFYALGICVAAASLTFLVRWLGFRALAGTLCCLLPAPRAKLWRVSPDFLPLYAVFVVYTLARLGRGGARKPESTAGFERLAEPESRVRWPQAAIVFALVAVALLPVLAEALSLYREARAHVITEAPSLRDLLTSLKYALILECAVGAWLAAALFRWPARAPASRASIAMILAWWLCMPVGLSRFFMAHRKQRLPAAIPIAGPAWIGSGRYSGCLNLRSARGVEAVRGPPRGRGLNLCGWMASPVARASRLGLAGRVCKSKQLATRIRNTGDLSQSLH